MNIKHEKIEAIRVPLRKPFSDFYVEVVPASDVPKDGKDWRRFSLYGSGQGHSMYMFDSPVDDDNDAVEMAYWNGPEYIEHWIEEVDALNEYFEKSFGEEV